MMLISRCRFEVSSLLLIEARLLLELLLGHHLWLTHHWLTRHCLHHWLLCHHWLLWHHARLYHHTRLGHHSRLSDHSRLSHCDWSSYRNRCGNNSWLGNLSTSILLLSVLVCIIIVPWRLHYNRLLDSHTWDLHWLLWHHPWHLRHHTWLLWHLLAHSWLHDRLAKLVKLLLLRLSVHFFKFNYIISL